jgi:cell division protein FtsB
MFVAAYAVISLLRLQIEINDTQARNEQLSTNIERQKRANSKMEESLDDENNDEFVAGLARKNGYIADGERLFRDKN